MSALFLDALHLVPSNTRNQVQKTGPLTLQINLKPHQSRECVIKTPKTPCSMLSPLTPKFKKLEWDTLTTTPERDLLDYDDDPSLALMMIDITSNLGRRLSSTLFLLVDRQACIVTAEYDKFCNQGQPPIDPDVRQLRSLEGRCLPAYRKRLCHRHLDRVYLFKAADKKERQKTLLSGGLNKTSRRLFRQMKYCTVLLEKLNLKRPPWGVYADEQCRSADAEPVVMLQRLNCDQAQVGKKPAELIKANDINGRTKDTNLTVEDGAEKGDPNVFVILTPKTFYSSQRKSLRRKNVPRKLLHVI